MKREYTKPSMRVVLLQSRSLLLSVSTTTQGQKSATMSVTYGEENWNEN